MAESEPRKEQSSRTAHDSAISIQEMFDLHERVLGRLGLLPGTPALDSHRELVVKTRGGETAGKEKVDERES